jgi:ribosomal protein S1
VRPGDEVRVKVLRVDRKRQRIGLSRRQAEEAAGPVEEDEPQADEADADEE